MSETNLDFRTAVCTRKLLDDFLKNISRYGGYFIKIFWIASLLGLHWKLSGHQPSKILFTFETFHCILETSDIWGSNIIFSGSFIFYMVQFCQFFVYFAVVSTTFLLITGLSILILKYYYKQHHYTFFSNSNLFSYNIEFQFSFFGKTRMKENSCVSKNGSLDSSAK